MTKLNEKRDEYIERFGLALVAYPLVKEQLQISMKSGWDLALAEVMPMLEEMAGALQQKACFCNNNWQTGPTICIRCEVLDKYKQWKAGE